MKAEIIFKLLLVTFGLVPSVGYCQELSNENEYRYERLKVIAAIPPFMTAEEQRIVNELTAKAQNVDFSAEVNALKNNKSIWVEIGNGNNFRNFKELMTGICGMLPKQVQFEVTYRLLHTNASDDLSDGLSNRDVVSVPDCKPLKAKIDSL